MMEELFRIKDKDKLIKKIKKEIDIIKFIRMRLILDVLSEYQEERYTTLEVYGANDGRFIRAESRCEGVERAIELLESYEDEARDALLKAKGENKCKVKS